MPAFHTVLIANRGEIALRIARSCRALGLGVVAVFSDADEGAPWVRAADRAVRLGPAPSRASYLSIDRLVAAARSGGADAVHPGYGFLSEDAGFAEACATAGLVFVGPPAEVIRRLGSKVEAKRLAVAAGVPVVPGFDPDRPEAIRYPVLVKASAGGGGRGMRIVRRPDELEAALAGARREAAAAFGDDTLLLERLIERPRHVEIQILADQHGRVVHLGERDCSIQRRHQKVVEESPAPDLDDGVRRAMAAAALALARAVGYQNAGTVEFIVAPGGEFFFLEVNTRLQVEHPVTEAVTGLDLVAAQLRIARGEPLALAEDAARPRGHAVEVRLYAEDPAAGFLPTSGPLLDWSWPALPGLRVDAGVVAGGEVGTHYDPMLAKVIAHAPSRGEALALLAAALEQASVLGLATNRELLVRILRHPEMIAGAVDTGFLDRNPALAAPAADLDADDQAAVAATLARALRRRARRTVLPALRPGFRNNPAEQVQRLRVGGREIAVAYAARDGGGFAARVGDAASDGAGEIRVAWWSEPELALERDGVVRRFRVVASGEEDGARVWVHQGGRAVALDEVPRFPVAAEAAVAGGTAAPMPGRVVKVLVAPGAAVAEGEPLVVLEAMKMEHTVCAARAGTVERILVAAGDQVAAGAALIVLST